MVIKHIYQDVGAYIQSWTEEKSNSDEASHMVQLYLVIMSILLKFVS